MIRLSKALALISHDQDEISGVYDSPNSLLMLLGVKIDDFLDHCLIRNVVLTRFRLEEIDAPLAQRQCDLNRAFFENEFIRTWQEIRHNLRLSYGLSDSFRRLSVFALRNGQ